MKKILVVDDEPMMCKIYSRFLKGEGYDVIAAPNSVEANELLKNDRVDLVLLDLCMPRVKGDVLYQVIRHFHRDVKVVVSSVYQIEKQRRLVPGAADYYDKSQGIDILLDKIRKILGEGEAFVS